MAVLLALSVPGITLVALRGETVNGIQASAEHHGACRGHLVVRGPGAEAAPPRQHGGQAELRGADTVLRAAEQAGLRGPMWLYPPAEAGEAWKVAERKRDWPTCADAIAVDPETGAVTDRANLAQWPCWPSSTDWTIDAHMGLLFGIANQIVLAIAMAGLITVIVRGYRMWWQRRPTRGSAWAWAARRRAGRCGSCRLGQRGDRRRRGRHRVVLPLFGLSLVAFLLVDVAVAWWKERSNV